MDIVSLAANASVIGAAVGYLRWGQMQNSKDITSIKRALGLENGKDSAFVRTSEWQLDRYAQEQRQSRVEEELRDLRARLND